jgi:hypothetical protein
LSEEAIEELPELDIVETTKKFSKNFHKGRLDLNVVYNKRKSMIANFISAINKKVMD